MKYYCRYLNCDKPKCKPFPIKCSDPEQIIHQAIWCTPTNTIMIFINPQNQLHTFITL